MLKKYLYFALIIVLSSRLTIILSCLYFGYTPRSEIAESYGNSTFKYIKK